MATRGSLYTKLIGGQNLNIADLLLENYGNVSKPVERIIVECDTTNGLAIAITLPRVSDLGPATNFQLMVVDKGGNAAVGNITITRAGTDKVNSGTNTVINTNNGSAHIEVGAVASAGASVWVAINTSAISAAVAAAAVVQTREEQAIGGGGTIVLAQIPLTTKHIILSTEAGVVLRQGTDFTVDAPTKTLTFPVLAPGVIIQAFYSYQP